MLATGQVARLGRTDQPHSLRATVCGLVSGCECRSERTVAEQEVRTRPLWRRTWRKLTACPLCMALGGGKGGARQPFWEGAAASHKMQSSQHLKKKATQNAVSCMIDR